MACYYPLTAWRGGSNDSGKRSLVFSKHLTNLPGSEMQIPCGQCIGCRLERSRQWAVRCVHEASLYDRNCFLTLTYNNECLPGDGSLQVSDFQKFMKRLRKAFPDDHIRYFQCGEYGEQNARPHYHACLFNFDFDDKIQWSVRNGIPLYVSETLNRIWGLGYCVIGEVTFDSAAYVARYIMKKITGDKAEEYYNGKHPEYTTMSRRPGIASDWYQKFKADVFPHDYLVVKGAKVRPPRFYQNIYEIEDPVGFASLKDRRMRKVKFAFPLHARLAGWSFEVVDNSFDRLQVKQMCKFAQITSLKRCFESNDYI